ncbi:Zn-dependent exopeptidase [Dichomitus squalens]|uniref:Zn-dependent exopeptidase n=1 Tax=Dichomitus squalens TaxID=114155 RepID=A0A4Q9NXM7_9APHY|nr:Zn-dependent exopeptidase [Dichomitus squalens]TBU58413.1 Zn-dependent exopeptidase [Dichomitus squalens]
MADLDEKKPFEKARHLDEIPVPVAAVPPPTRQPPRGRRFLVAFLKLALLTSLWICARRWTQTGVEQELEAHEGRWISRAFGGEAWTWSPRKVLRGKKAEKLFLSVPNPASAIAASRQYATKPHLAGTDGDFETAKNFLRLLQTELGAGAPGSIPLFSAGTPESRNATLGIPQLTKPTAWIDTYYPVMNTPLDHSVEILDDNGNVVWKAELEEVADETDPEAGKYFDAVTTWHGLSRGGSARGKLVYANYGKKEDFDALVEQGVDLNGSIVITRYGGIFRGLKVKGAQEHGAAACLIYSDPRDDGTVTVENGYAPYPHGPARNPNSVQRGSTQFLSIYPGDPTTPGYPSYENSTRTNGTNIPSIPSLPISWANAQVLLKEIQEGGQNRTISLVNNVDDKVIPIWNVLGVIPGHIKDEVVVIGNHRDAWVLGAVDPSSGTSSVHEVIRGLGALLRHGWTPLRTIVIASWDAEEYGLIGSTEWGEDFEDWIDEHVVAYLNLDGSVSGSRFNVQATPSLAHFLRAAAEEIPHPTQPGKTLWDATKDRGVLTGDHIDAEVLAMHSEAEAELAASSTGVGVLGSGSDYTVFVQRTGVASAGGGFGSTLQDPVYHYHSIFDSERWIELYGDPGFFRHVAVAKYLGLQTIRLADSIVLPLNTTHHAFELEKYLEKVEELASTTSLDVDFSDLRNAIQSLQKASLKLDHEKVEAEHKLRKLLHKFARRHLFRRTFRRALCKLKRFLGKDCAPFRKDASAVASPAIPTVDKAFECSGMKSGKGNKNGLLPFKPRVGHAPAVAQEQREQAMGEELYALDKKRFPSKKFKKAVKRVREVNKKLKLFERGFIDEEGIKDREWYRNLDVAPGKWLGYGATTFPALTEAITIDKNHTLAVYEAKRLQKLVEKLTHVIKV